MQYTEYTFMRSRTHLIIESKETGVCVVKKTPTITIIHPPVFIVAN